MGRQSQDNQAVSHLIKAVQLRGGTTSAKAITGRIDMTQDFIPLEEHGRPLLLDYGKIHNARNIQENMNKNNMDFVL